MHKDVVHGFVIFFNIYIRISCYVMNMYVFIVQVAHIIDTFSFPKICEGHSTVLLHICMAYNFHPYITQFSVCVLSTRDQPSA